MLHKKPGVNDSRLYFMKKAYPYITSAVIALSALVPPIKFIVPEPQTEYWLYVILLVAFLGLYPVFTKIHWVLKMLLIYAFVDCFFSSCPHESFTLYISLVGCFYLYFISKRIVNWNPVFKTLYTIIFINGIFMLLKFFGHDPLINQYGVVGQHMQMGSFSVVVSCMLIQRGIWWLLLPFLVGIICNSMWSLICVFLGIYIFTFQKNRTLALNLIPVLLFLCALAVYPKATNLTPYGRMGVWWFSINTGMDHFWFGWGGGMYKILFPALSKMQCDPWKTAHNFWMELFFEWGFIGFVIVNTALKWVYFQVRKSKSVLLLVGYSVLLIDMLVHFPDRMFNCVPIMITFFAFCNNQANGEHPRDCRQ